MGNFIQTLKNIWNIEELRNRILTTLGLVLIFRIGTYIVLPGINPGELENLSQQGEGGIFSLINIFAGGAFSRADRHRARQLSRTSKSTSSQKTASRYRQQ